VVKLYAQIGITNSNQLGLIGLNVRGFYHKINLVDSVLAEVIVQEPEAIHVQPTLILEDVVLQTEYGMVLMNLLTGEFKSTLSLKNITLNTVSNKESETV
jgi:hypothetical protein